MTEERAIYLKQSNEQVKEAKRNATRFRLTKRQFETMKKGKPVFILRDRKGYYIDPPGADKNKLFRDLERLRKLDAVRIELMRRIDILKGGDYSDNL